MKNLNILLLVCLGSLPLSSHAAKPLKISLAEKISTAEGIEYRNYTVQCSNNTLRPMTSWNSGKKWCVGGDSQVNCAKRKISAAKKTCKFPESRDQLASTIR